MKIHLFGQVTFYFDVSLIRDASFLTGLLYLHIMKQCQKNRCEDSLLGLLIENIKSMGADYPKPAFIEPDYRFFVDTGQTAEETIDLVFRVLEKFDNDSQSI